MKKSTIGAIIGFLFAVIIVSIYLIWWDDLPTFFDFILIIFVGFGFLLTNIIGWLFKINFGNLQSLKIFLYYLFNIIFYSFLGFVISKGFFGSESEKKFWIKTVKTIVVIIVIFVFIFFLLLFLLSFFGGMNYDPG